MEGKIVENYYAERARVAKYQLLAAQYLARVKLYIGWHPQGVSKSIKYSNGDPIDETHKTGYRSVAVKKVLASLNDVVQYKFTTDADLVRLTHDTTQAMAARKNQLFRSSLDPEDKKYTIANRPPNMDRGRLETALIRAELGGKALKGWDIAVVCVLLGIKDKVELIDRCPHLYPKVKNFWW